MELTFKELKKRDVINISDGRCLGRVIDLTLCFPEGILTGITVSGKKGCRLFSLFDKSELFIGVKKILKIGGDVIIVDLKKGGDLDKPCIEPPRRNKPRQQNCAPPRCDKHDEQGLSANDFINTFDGRLDEGDY